MITWHKSGIFFLSQHGKWFRPSAIHLTMLGKSFSHISGSVPVVPSNILWIVQNPIHWVDTFSDWQQSVNSCVIDGIVDSSVSGTSVDVRSIPDCCWVVEFKLFTVVGRHHHTQREETRITFWLIIILDYGRRITKRKTKEKKIFFFKFNSPLSGKKLFVIGSLLTSQIYTSVSDGLVFFINSTHTSPPVVIFPFGAVEVKKMENYFFLENFNGKSQVILL